MRRTTFTWLDREFIALSALGDAELEPADATRELLSRFDVQLRQGGLSLANTVRTRLFAGDRPSREQASTARRELLSGPRRSVSSSFVVPELFDSPGPVAAVAMDLLAMRPQEPGAEKLLLEYDPPRAPLRVLAYESLVFLSGVTSAQGALEEQIATILAEIEESLGLVGAGWDRAVLVSCFLHGGEDLAGLQGLLRQVFPGGRPPWECELVEGYASEGCRIEIEVTAER